MIGLRGWIYAVALALLAASGQCQAQSAYPISPTSYLPPGATIQDREKHLVTADLDADGRQEVVIFYSLGEDTERKNNILVLELSEEGYRRSWSQEDEYGSLWFADPTGVRRIRRGERLQIVAYRQIGSSCQGMLSVFEMGDRVVRRITPDWGGYCQNHLRLEDLDGDGNQEIIFKKYNRGVNPDIYRWNGQEYVQANQDFPAYYDGELRKVTKACKSDGVYPASARVSWCKQAVEIYLLQERHPEALAIARQLLAMIDDERTGYWIKGEDMSGTSLSRLDKRRAKADAYDLLANTFRAIGNQKEAAENERTAAELRNQAQ